MKPLEGVKVLELANYLAAPSCARILADWGAEVIKVEPLEGDVYRKLGPSQRIPIFETGNPCFDIENVNKKYVALNLKTQTGMDLFLELLSKADVFVTNNRPKALKKLHISYEDLKDKYPKLIFADILGYGEKGPEGHRPGFDYTTFYARTGFMGDLSPKGQDVLSTIAGFGDHTAGLGLVAGICAALLKRERTGLGDRVDVGLLQVGLYIVSCGIMMSNFGREFPRSRLEPNTPTSNTYKCKDGEWIYLAATDYNTQWPKICNDILNRPDLAENPKYNSVKEVAKNMTEVVKILDEIFITQDSDYWIELLKKNDVAHEKVCHFRDVVNDQQAWANDYIREHTYEGGEKVLFVNSPVTFASIDKLPFNTSGPIGCDTESVLLDLGYTKEQIDKLKENGDVK